MFGEIDVFVYDQDNKPVPNATLEISCSRGTHCLFLDGSENLITSGTTDSNGELKFFFSSVQRGGKQVLVSLPSISAFNTTEWEVMPILNCQNSTFTGVATRNGTIVTNDGLTDLIMNADNALFQSHIVDLFGNPLENKTTTIHAIYPGKKVKRGRGAEVIYSDADGNANYTSQDQGLQTVTFVGQFETCSETHPLDVRFHYEPDCTDSTVTPFSAYTLPIESNLVISAQYAESVGKLTGATINVYWNGGNTQMYLDDNDQANATISYLAGAQVSQMYTLDFYGASPTCDKTIAVTWIRSCNAQQSTMTFNNDMLNTDQQLEVDVTVNDSQGYSLEGLEVTISGSLHIASDSGITDVNGKFAWYPLAPESDGIETFTATIAGNCTLTSQMTWTSPTI